MLNRDLHRALLSAYGKVMAFNDLDLAIEHMRTSDP
jgi:hypothetical protein